MIIYLGGKPTHKSKGIPMLASSNYIDRPRADVEPIVRSLSAVTIKSQNVNLHLLEAKVRFLCLSFIQ